MLSASTRGLRGYSAGMRKLQVSAERIERWLSGFHERHGGPPTGRPPRWPVWTATADRVVVRAADGSVAELEVPFPPMHVDVSSSYGGLIAHARAARLVGVVLVRRGGYAAGVFEGADLLTSKVGSRLVQGRSAAGGWSQGRFARRREKQASEAFGAAADTVVRVLSPYVDRLDALVLGGDRQAVRKVLADDRLEPLRSLVVPPHLDVPDPKLAVLQRTPEMFRAVRIRLDEAAPEAGPGVGR